MREIPDVEQYAKMHEKEALDLLKELAQLPAPSCKEGKRASFCEKWMKKQGAMQVEIDEANNVICLIGIKNKNIPLLAIMAHSDVVFPDENELPIKEDNDRIYCPGIGDDTANVAALLMTVKYFLENQLESEKIGLLFIVNSGEEGLGNLKGSKKIFEDYGDRIQAMVSFDVMRKNICTTAIGSKRYKISIQTEGGHSFQDFGKPNAIAHLASLIHTLYEVKVPPNSRTTYNVGMISGGTSVNTIAQQAEMLYEFRSDQRESLDFMEKQLEEILACTRRKGIKVQAEEVGNRPCSGDVDMDKEKRLVELASPILEKNWKEKPAQIAASTDCNIPLSMGIPAICVSCCQGGGVHTRDEYVEKESLLPGLKIALELTQTLFHEAEFLLG